MFNDGTIRLKVAAPERVVISEDVASVLVPASSGPLLVLPRRAPLISSLKVGVLEVNRKGGAKKVFAVEGGMVEVKDGACVVLTEGALEITAASRMDYAHNLVEYRKKLKEAKTESERHLLNNHIKYLKMFIRTADNLKNQKNIRK